MPIGSIDKQLAQKRENSTNAVSIYSLPDADTHAVLTSIEICNTTSGGETYRIFLDDDGTTYDESTALFFDVTIGANTTVQIDCGVDGWGMSNSSGNLAYRSSAANAITVTVFGREVVVR